MTNETIVLAAPAAPIARIYPQYPAFYEKFCAQAAPFHAIKTLVLPDIWVRDFLPVQNVQTGELYQPFFNPHYANYTPVFMSAIRKAAKAAFPAKDCKVQIDGGNMIWGQLKRFFAKISVNKTTRYGLNVQTGDKNLSEKNKYQARKYRFYLEGTKIKENK